MENKRYNSLVRRVSEMLILHGESMEVHKFMDDALAASNLHGPVKLLLASRDLMMSVEIQMNFCMELECAWNCKRNFSFFSLWKCHGGFLSSDLFEPDYFPRKQFDYYDVHPSGDGHCHFRCKEFKPEDIAEELFNTLQYCRESWRNMMQCRLDMLQQKTQELSQMLK
jgi:hypothetical protein